MTTEQKAAPHASEGTARFQKVSTTTSYHEEAPRRKSDEEQVRRFLQRLIGNGGGYYELRAFRESEENLPPEVRRWFQRPGEVISTISSCVRRGLHIYVGVAARQDRRGDKASLLYLDWLFCELDFKNFDGGEEEARARIAAYPIPPTMVIASGGGLQCYWAVERILLPEELARVEAVLKGFADDLGADIAATDAGRILRVPGTFNVKRVYGSPRPVVLEVAPEGRPRRYRLEDFPAREVSPATETTPAVEACESLIPDDEVLLQRALTAKNGRLFAALWAGEWQERYKTQHSADIALCRLLAFWTQDVERIDRLFRQSGLMRPKWDEGRGEQTYGARTILRALKDTTASYAPRQTRLEMRDSNPTEPSADAPQEANQYPWTAATWEQWAKDAIKHQDAQNEAWRWQWASWYASCPFPKGKEQIAAAVFGEKRWRTVRNYARTLTAWQGIDRRDLPMSKCMILNHVPPDIKRDYADRCYEEGLTVDKIKQELRERGLLESKAPGAWELLKETATPEDAEYLQHLIDTEGATDVLARMRATGLLPRCDCQPQKKDNPEPTTSRYREVAPETEASENPVNETVTPHDNVRSDGGEIPLPEGDGETHDNMDTGIYNCREVALPLDSAPESPDEVLGQKSTPICPTDTEPETPSAPQAAAPEEAAPTPHPVFVRETPQPAQAARLSATPETTQTEPAGVILTATAEQAKEARRDAVKLKRGHDRTRTKDEGSGLTDRELMTQEYYSRLLEVLFRDTLLEHGVRFSGLESPGKRPNTCPDLRIGNTTFDLKSTPPGGSPYMKVGARDLKHIVKRADYYIGGQFLNETQVRVFAPVPADQVRAWQLRSLRSDYYSKPFRQLRPLCSVDELIDLGKPAPLNPCPPTEGFRRIRAELERRLNAQKETRTAERLFDDALPVSGAAVAVVEDRVERANLPLLPPVMPCTVAGCTGQAWYPTHPEEPKFCVRHIAAWQADTSG
jgi:hypothetical protein